MSVPVNPQTEWVRSLADAADELGYHIESIQPNRIVLVDTLTPVEITVSGIFVSGETLRRALAPLASRATKPEATVYAP